MVRSLVYAVAALAASTAAMTLGPREELYTLELAPGVTKVVTESEKWELKRQGKKFFDITGFDPTPSSSAPAAVVTYPATVGYRSVVNKLLPSLSSANIKSTLTTFSNFYNRYYQSSYGEQSSNWLLAQVEAIITASNATAAVKVAPFVHSWGQNSVIATIPGQSESVVIISAHQDSINQANPSSGRAPGADDDGSASMEIMEIFRVLLTDQEVSSGKALNTIEFHWYAAEEGGLLGSQAIFQSYKQAGRDVKGMFHQDLTGYVAPGTTESIGLFTDYTTPTLVTFVRKCIKAYSSLPVVSSKCGYACSDHASAYKNGFPAALISEGSYENSSPYLHTDQDTLSTVDFDHLLEMTKAALGIAYELGFASM
ncbi:hypothetical protein BJ170DRAFT_614653 [Xylariales sp. AK1849]|nr:hypothetical protein BJ170DRAFT_614653 [Xylariales sp. AK1849]